MKAILCPYFRRSRRQRKPDPLVQIFLEVLLLDVLGGFVGNNLPADNLVDDICVLLVIFELCVGCRAFWRNSDRRSHICRLKLTAGNE